MIKSLCLENFGRFKSKTFDLAPVTLFTGLNESGKTTLFDAITDAISSPRASTKPGKILAERYGSNRKVYLEQDGEPLSIDIADFLNLFAIRSGEISLKIEQNSQWMNQVKASLFQGGIDPKSIVDELETRIKGRGKDSLNAESKKVTEEITAFEKEKKKAEVQRQKYLEEEKRIRDAGSRMAQIGEEIHSLTKKCGELETYINQQDLLQQAKILKENLGMIGEKRHLENEQDKYIRFSSAQLEDLIKMDEEIQYLKTEVKTAAALEEENLHLLSAAVEEKACNEIEKPRGDTLLMLAGFLRDTLVPREKHISKKTGLYWRKPFLIVAFLLLIAVVIVSIFAANSRVNNWVYPAVILGVAVICAAMAPARRTWEDTSALDAAIKEAREKWKRETGEDPGEHYEDILSAMDRAAEKSRSAGQEFKKTIQRVAELEKEKVSLALRKKHAEDAATSAQRQLSGILNEAGAAAITDYAALLEKKENAAARCREMDAKLKNALAANGAASITELEDILGRRMTGITEKIMEAELPANELNIKKNLLRETKKRLDELQREDKNLIAGYSLNLGTVRAQLQGLPEKIAALEKSMLEKRNRLAEIKKLFRAAIIAQKLFISIAEDSSYKLEQLSLEIGEKFSALTGTGRSVKMKSYSADNVCVSDSQNLTRNSELLSAGTYDAFLLAARLILARKSLDESKRAIIVLDEPFLSLDRPRTGNALAVLKDFYRNTLWQIVLFTKDEETASQAQAVFGAELRVHNLDLIQEL